MSSNEPHEFDTQDPRYEIPRPTFAPAAMAMGVMMLLWGLVTMWIMSVAGAGLIAWSLWTWINEIRQE